MLFRYALAWLLLMAAAIANGVLRQYGYGPFLSELHAHQLSSVTGIALFWLLTWWLHRIWPLASARQAWQVGVMWLVMTLCFEFLFGHFVAGHSWSRLLADYDLLAGRLWVLVLLAVLIAPWLMFVLGNRRTR